MYSCGTWGRSCTTRGICSLQVLYGADQIPSWRNRMYFTGDRNTVNSCCTISILKNPQQFAWGWEIRHQTSKNRRILHESACMLAGGCTPKWAQFRRPRELAVPTVLLSEKYSCTDRYSTIARHFPYGTSVCSSLTSENFGQNRLARASGDGHHPRRGGGGG